MEKALMDIAKKGFLISPNLKIKEQHTVSFLNFLEKLNPKPLVVSNEIYDKFLETSTPAHSKEYVILRHADKRPDIQTNINIKKNYTPSNKKPSISDWASHYLDRYNTLRNILQNREDLRGTISIGRAKKADGRSKVSLIGIVQNIRKTFSGGTIITLEDPTGLINLYLKKEISSKIAQEIVFDEVIGAVGTKSKDFVYVEKIVFPEIPLQPIKKAEDEVYAAFISDIHLGSYVFLANEFKQFIKWIGGKTGSKEQRDMASKTRYLFVAGDVVDGVGVYPGQEKELLIKDVYTQYKEVAKHFSQIPEDVQIMIVPGNHDALKLAEPQHALFKDIAAPLYDLDNIHMLSNPSLVNIHNIGKFPGFDTLIYHGVSFDRIVSEVPSFRKDGYERADKIMEFLLRKRHLSPTHGAVRIDPTPQDFLTIDKIPDIFATGHIHYTNVGRYKNILTLNSGCFQDKTEFQMKLGHNPTPGRVPIVNLKTNHTKILRFK